MFFLLRCGLVSVRSALLPLNCSPIRSIHLFFFTIRIFPLLSEFDLVASFLFFFFVLMAYQPIPGPTSGSSASSGFQYLNSPFGDTTLTKVFVGGLAWETQSETMRRHFEQYGEILEAVVITDKNTGRSKGYGFVSVSCLFLIFDCKFDQLAMPTSDDHGCLKCV